MYAKHFVNDSIKIILLINLHRSSPSPYGVTASETRPRRSSCSPPLLRGSRRPSQRRARAYTPHATQRHAKQTASPHLPAAVPCALGHATQKPGGAAAAAPVAAGGSRRGRAREVGRTVLGPRELGASAPARPPRLDALPPRARAGPRARPGNFC